MALEIRATFSASNSAVAPPDSSVEAVLDSSIFALASAVAGIALAATVVVAWPLAAAGALPTLGAVGAGFSAGLPIFMVLSKGRGEGTGHSICTVYRPLLE
jgi:hypothetical protein